MSIKKIKRDLIDLIKTIKPDDYFKNIEKSTDEVLDVLSHPEANPEKLAETKRFIKAVDCKELRNTKI